MNLPASWVYPASWSSTLVYRRITRCREKDPKGFIGENLPLPIEFLPELRVFPPIMKLFTHDPDLLTAFRYGPRCKDGGDFPQVFY